VLIYDKMLHHNQPLTLVEAATKKDNPHMLRPCMLHVWQAAHIARAACNTSAARRKGQRSRGAEQQSSSREAAE